MPIQHKVDPTVSLPFLKDRFADVGFDDLPGVVDGNQIAGARARQSFIRCEFFDDGHFVQSLDIYVHG